METIYLYNVFGHFRPKNVIQANNNNFLMYLLTSEINHYIDPWIEYLENPEKIKVHGSLAAMQKINEEIVAIVWRFDYIIGKENYRPYYIKIPALIGIIKDWQKIILQQPKGILMIFGKEYEDVEFVPDWKGCRYEIMQQELKKREPENANGF